MEVGHFDSCLYTYCSLSTLKTITEKGTLRFSDIRKSNDHKELVYGFNQIKKRLETLGSDNRELVIMSESALKQRKVSQDETGGILMPLSDDSIELCERYNARLYAYFVQKYFDCGDRVDEKEFLGVCECIVRQLSDISRAMKRERVASRTT